MKVGSIKTFHGANFYTQRAAVVAKIESGDLPATNIQNVSGFNDRLIAAFPSLKDHFCGKKNGLTFAEQLKAGMRLDHAVGHISLELLDQITSGRNEKPSCCVSRTWHDRLVIETRYPDVIRYLVPQAVNIAEALLHGHSPNLEDILENARQILTKIELGPSGRSIVEAAELRGIPWSRENNYSLVQLGYGRNLHFVQAAVTDLSSDIAVDIVCNKDETKKRLERFSIPTPAGYVVYTEDEAVDAFEAMPFPVVIKPLNGNHGRGVTLDLATRNDVKLAFHHARTYSSSVLIEELFEGKNYRVLIVGGKLAAASEREAGKVIGDGWQTLQELVTAENLNPLRGDGHEKPLTKFKMTSTVMENLLKHGWTLDSIIPLGTEIEVSVGMNLSTGGTARDVTDEVHRSVQLMCERAARVVNLDICGIDLMLPDITRPLPQEHGGIIEINAAPGLRMHLYPTEGKARDVGAAIVEMLYPNNAPSRIPIIAITGTNGKTTVTRMISHILGATGRNIGTTTTDGIMLNGENIVFGDMTGPASARTILSDKIVDIAVLETARGGILRRGLGWDWADIAVVTNITEDHIGQDGIETLKDLVEIKSVIAERVRDGGTLVLNADDPESANLVHRRSLKGAKHNVVFFSTQETNPIVEKHVELGGTAYLLQGQWICEAIDGQLQKLVETPQIPITIHGTAEYQIQNVMASIAAARAMGMSDVLIADALITFSGDRNNQGRTNIYSVNQGFAVIDYGHNPKAIESIGRMISSWGMKNTAIISFPGDRTDGMIEASTVQAAKAFDRIIIKSDRNLRGRREGEVGEIMAKVIAANGGPADTTFESDPITAFDREVSAIRPNEVLVFFYEKLGPVQEILRKHNAIPTEIIFQASAVQALSGGNA